MASVRNKYSEKDSRMWVLHWDHQMYKALESSYQMGLESLNENLPEIKVLGFEYTADVFLLQGF